VHAHQTAPGKRNRADPQVRPGCVSHPVHRGHCPMRISGPPFSHRFLSRAALDKVAGSNGWTRPLACAPGRLPCALGHLPCALGDLACAERALPCAARVVDPGAQRKPNSGRPSPGPGPGSPTTLPHLATSTRRAKRAGGYAQIGSAQYDGTAAREGSVNPTDATSPRIGVTMGVYCSSAGRMQGHSRPATSLRPSACS
jgi:hypothetical protein